MTNLVSAAVLASQLVISNTAAQTWADAARIAQYGTPAYRCGDTAQYRDHLELPVVLMDAQHHVITTNYLDVTEVYNFVKEVRRIISVL